MGVQILDPSVNQGGVTVDMLIERLQKIREESGNLPVVIDFDSEGYYVPGEINLVEDEDELFINIQMNV